MTNKITTQTQKLNKALEFFGRGFKHEPETREIIVERLKRLIADGYDIKPLWDGGRPRINHKVNDNRILDHTYRLIKDGSTIYVTEPYSVYEFGALREATQQGWHVSIQPGESLWYPGRTIAIHFTRPTTQGATL